jgi:hypothetical protein
MKNAILPYYNILYNYTTYQIILQAFFCNLRLEIAGNTAFGVLFPVTHHRLVEAESGNSHIQTKK